MFPGWEVRGSGSLGSDWIANWIRHHKLETLEVYTKFERVPRNYPTDTSRIENSCVLQIPTLSEGIHDCVLVRVIFAAKKLQKVIYLI